MQRIKPMLSTLIDAPFDHEEWLFEIKWDGYRALANVNDQSVDLYSRNFLSFNDTYPHIVDDLKKMHLNAVLDGEIVILDDQGKSQFQLLQNYQNSFEGNPQYYVFDLLFLDNQDLRMRPLIERKKLLKKVLNKKKTPCIHFSDHILTKGIALFEKAKEHELEGIMGKSIHSLYYPGKRTKEWVKIKVAIKQQAIICGFTKPKGSRSKFGALVLGVYKEGKLTYAGDVGTGFNERTLNEVHSKLLPLIQSKCPFDSKAKYRQKEISWVKPKLTCEVSFQEWTNDGRMRHPVFLGLK